MGYGSIVRTPFTLTAAATLGLALLSASWTMADDAPRKRLRLPAPDAGEVPAPPLERFAPDPPAITASRFWVFDLQYDDGDLYLGTIDVLDKGRDATSPRAMGRFAIELYDGEDLVERVRFDFPMLGGAAGPDLRGRSSQVRVKSRVGVVFPETSRGDRFELWDRAKNERWSLPSPTKR